MDNIPYNEMAKRNWDFIEKTGDPFTKVVNLRRFFAVASLKFNTDLKKKLAFRKCEKESFSLEALYCYIRFGEIQTVKDNYSKYNIQKN